MSTALFVDLPNSYSSLLESNIDEPRTLRDYFLLWFDFDRLAERLTKEFSPVWVFYSGRHFGPRSNRVEDTYLDTFISRCNKLTGVTAHDVDIPGEQREVAKYLCEQCGREGVAQWESEKGIDASLAVHMFDTADSWDSAILLSGDADYVPAVRSLRRRGKIVMGAGFSNPSTALVRECYEYVDLASDFMTDDVVAFRAFNDHGIATSWLESDIRPTDDPKTGTGNIDLTVVVQYEANHEWTEDSHTLNLTETAEGGPRYAVYFMAEGPMSTASREDALANLRNAFPKYFRAPGRHTKHPSLRISPVAWGGVTRRLASFTATHQTITVTKQGSTEVRMRAIYAPDPSSGTYRLVEAET